MVELIAGGRDNSGVCGCGSSLDVPGLITLDGVGMGGGPLVDGGGMGTWAGVDPAPNGGEDPVRLK
jgi:hypothetical protein